MNFRRMILDPRIALLSLVMAVTFAGCITGPMNPATTQPVTISDPATTQPEYWYDKPSDASVVYDSFPTLYKTCENVARDFGFQIDRIDYRTGLLTTVPLDSAQIWEFWRPDVRTLADKQRSTISTIRRTIRFEFVRNLDGTFECTPKVLVERKTTQERRITSVALYRGAFTAETSKDMPTGTKESDEGFMIPAKFWYAIGRDPALEKKLAHVISARLARKGREMKAGATTQQ